MYLVAMHYVSSATTTRHPIQVASKRSGVSADVIRAWERRYDAVKPIRERGNRRLYSDDDIERLYLLAQVTGAGRRIGDVAQLPLAELRAIFLSDQQAVGPRPVEDDSPGGAQNAAEHVQHCLDAISELDAIGLDAALATAAVDLTTPVLLEQLLVPLMHTLGERWRDGTMRMAHEHLATVVVRAFLGSLMRNVATGDQAPEVVVATPQGQRHEIGSLVAAVAAVADGWRATYLGAGMSAEQIARAVRERGARAVALGITYPPDDPQLAEEIRKLHGLLGQRIKLFAGGAATSGYVEVLEECGAEILSDLGSFRKALESLRSRRLLD
jgi:DNA-binding transcriptional MerR regulator/methylmalonyl-CoA mutase cobalamin-binding subunit